MSNKLILGIQFTNQPVGLIYDKLSNDGGLLTVPSGPGLANIPNDLVYYRALQNADLVIADSGYMVLIWNLISKEKINRVSGLAFINHFVNQYPLETEKKSVFLVNPTAAEQTANLAYFNSVGIPVATHDVYHAPLYTAGQIEDYVLLDRLNQSQPHWVFLNIGGGVQEILGSWLKDNLNYKPAIICTGAAIAFKTGKQVKIPVWADKLYLGWLFRIISDPKKYTRRYWDSFSLLTLLLKYREKSPFAENVINV